MGRDKRRQVPGKVFVLLIKGYRRIQKLLGFLPLPFGLNANVLPRARAAIL